MIPGTVNVIIAFNKNVPVTYSAYIARVAIAVAASGCSPPFKLPLILYAPIPVSGSRRIYPVPFHC